MNFKQVAEAFRMIDQETVMLVARNYAPDAIEELLGVHEKARTASWFRSLRPYTVGVPKYEADKLRLAGLTSEHASGLLVYDGPYNSVFGIGTGDESDPADLIA
jgi:CRISPR-associated endonuclease/helicase Cas3